MAQRGAPSAPPHLVFSTSTAALQSYERHLKNEGEVVVDLFLFSENHELDIDKLTHKLGESAVNSQVSVLLLLTGAASYLWLDPEHNPRNVELCTRLKQQFPHKLNFVICPTSQDTRNAWEASAPQPQNVFGQFFDGNNVSVWDGFDRDVVSTSRFCSLIFKEDKGSKVVVQPKKDKSTPWSAGSAITAVQCLCLLYLLYQQQKQWYQQQKLLDAVEAEKKQRLDDAERFGKEIAAAREAFKNCTADGFSLPQWLRNLFQGIASFARGDKS